MAASIFEGRKCRTSLLALYPKIDLTRVRRRVRELADLMEEPGRIALLAQLLRERNSTPDRRPSRAVTDAPRSKPKKTRVPKRKRT
jgi:hypothetical protein